MSVNSIKSLFKLILILAIFQGCNKNEGSSPINEPQSGSNNAFKDPRDGQVYNTVKIGNQTWMAENLRYLPKVDGPDSSSDTIPYYYVYGHTTNNLADAVNTPNYKKYGVLYNYAAAIKSCPPGWHLPTVNEIYELDEFITLSYIAAGGTLKEVGTSNWRSPNLGATNIYNFNALPGGTFSGANANFYKIGEIGTWWHDSKSVWELRYNSNQLLKDYRLNGFVEDAYSIRCIKD